MKPTILMVDDDKQLLDELTVQLRNAFGTKYELEGVQTLEEAVELLETAMEEGLSIELIIADWLFPPNERSTQFLVDTALRYPHIPLLMLSGYANSEAVAYTEKYANLRAFFSKPWEETELITTIQQILTA